MTSDPLQTRLEDLSRPDVYGGESVVVHQTHISVVFVAGDRAFKLKKPVDLGFVDYSTVARRREYCEAEVRLNRRLAPHVYLGVRSVIECDGHLELGPTEAENAVDWVVEMKRLDERDNFLSMLHAGDLEADWLREVGHKMALFHNGCQRGEIGNYGSFETVAQNALDNFSQASQQVGRTVYEHVFEQAHTNTRDALERLKPLIHERDSTGHTRDTHGDLRLEHVYRVDAELCVVDCIEFNDAFRYADPISDIAFLVMDLRIRWADEHADALCEGYFSVRPGGRDLLDFYVAYRSAVRAKVHGMTSLSPEVDDSTRERALIKSKAHWLFAHATLADPDERPALILVGGLPGTGKSTLGKDLEAHAGFRAIDSDHVRKELAGISPSARAGAAHGKGIYTAEWTQKTYAECLERARAELERGGRVVVSATFKDDARRETFLHEAHRLGVPAYMLVCELEREEVAHRIRERKGDASDADLSVHDYVANRWEAPSDFVASRTHSVSTRTRRESLRQSLDLLEDFGLSQT